MRTQKGKIQMAERSLVAVPELPIIQQGDSLLISAKLLYQKLKIKTQFNHWISRRIEKYGFEDGQDYWSNLTNRSDGKAGKKLTDYLLTLDTAKELAMLEENEIGRAIRRYFIQKEKESRIALLPKEQQLFKGLKRKTINGRIMYAYKLFLREKAGYSDSSSGYHYRSSYPNHFVVMDNLAYISEELALQIYHSRRLSAARRANKAMQPVLPFDFGHSLTLKQGGSHD